MIQQLVMYEEELQQINKICDVLHRDSNAKAVLVIDKNGQAIAQAGDTHELDVTSLSSLTAGNVAATGGIAQLLAEREFAGQFHEGEKTNVHISIVGSRVILVVLFDERSASAVTRVDPFFARVVLPRTGRRATSVAMLAKQLSLGEQGLALTLDTYNANLELGGDPFGRECAGERDRKSVV